MDTVIGSAIGSFLGTLVFVTVLWIKDTITELKSYRKDRLEFHKDL